MPHSPARRRVGTLFGIAVAAFAVLAPVQAVAPPFACTGTGFGGGTGAVGDPYVIAAETHLQQLSESTTGCLDKHFRQTADIAITGGWAYVPIGDVSNKFVGTYDGTGREITGLVVNTSSRDSYLGLFGSVGFGGSIRHLTVTGRIEGTAATTHSGLIVGLLLHGQLTDVHARGTVVGATRLGGVVGFATYESVITRSSSSATVTGTQNVGGLVGSLQGSTISESHASGNVTATLTNAMAGGLTSSGSLYGSAYAVIENSYATGTVSGSASGVPGANGIGGIIGTAPGGGRLRVIYSYATGRLTRSSGSGTGFGGVIGSDAVAAAGSPSPIPSIFTGSAWNTDTVGALGALSGYGTALSSAQMQRIASFTALGWGIVPTGTAAGANPWGICHSINGGFPYLQWQHPAAICPATADSTGTTAPKVVDPSVAATLSAPVFSRATRGPLTGRTRLVTRLQLGAAGSYTFIVLPTTSDVRLAQYAGSAVGSRTLAAASWASTFTAGAADRRIVLRSYLSPKAIPLKGASVRLLVILRAPDGVLTSTLITAPSGQ